jgi:hypothetical protein
MAFIADTNRRTLGKARGWLQDAEHAGRWMVQHQRSDSPQNWRSALFQQTSSLTRFLTSGGQAGSLFAAMNVIRNGVMNLGSVKSVVSETLAPVCVLAASPCIGLVSPFQEVLQSLTKRQDP